MKSTLGEFTAAYVSRRVEPDPNAKSHFTYGGADPVLKVRIAFGTNPHGWYYSHDNGPFKGPYSTSEAAYDGFHDYMGWVRMDKVQP